MKRFHPLLIALLHAAVSFAMLILVVSSNPACPALSFLSGSFGMASKVEPILGGSSDWDA